MKGGDAYHHTINTYGGIGQQHSQQGTNLIAADGGKMPIEAVPLKGGSRKRRGGNLTNLAVAGLLTAASHMYGKKIKQ
jgi:hypothetical protein